jgi:zinc protease
VITGKFGTPDARLWMQLLYLLHTAPRFDATALQRVQLSRTEAARHRQEDPKKRFADAVSQIFFEPSASVGPIPEAEFAAVQLDDVARMFRERFSDPGEFDYVFVGDITPEALQGLLEAWVAPIPRGAAQREAAGDRGVRRARAPASVALTDGDGEKATLEWSWIGFGDSVAAERTALDAAAWVLEERLRARLREQLGGTYDVDVSDSWDDLPEPFLRAQVSFQCDPTRLAELEAALTDEVAKLVDGGVTAAELELWREQRVARDTQGRKTNPWWLSALSGVLARNAEAGSVFKVRERIDALQAADVDAVARRVLRSASVYKVTQRPPG